MAASRIRIAGGFAGGFRCHSDTGRLAIYYGAADTVTALAFGYLDELVEWTKANDVGPGTR